MARLRLNRSVVQDGFRIAPRGGNHGWTRIDTDRWDSFVAGVRRPRTMPATVRPRAVPQVASVNRRFPDRAMRCQPMRASSPRTILAKEKRRFGAGGRTCPALSPATFAPLRGHLPPGRKKAQTRRQTSCPSGGAQSAFFLDLAAGAGIGFRSTTGTALAWGAPGVLRPSATSFSRSVFKRATTSGCSRCKFFASGRSSPPIR